MRLISLLMACTACDITGRGFDKEVKSASRRNALAAFMLAQRSSLSAGRRTILPGLASTVVLPSLANAANAQAAYEGATLAQISPEAAMNSGFGRPASKSRPSTGVVLFEKVNEEAKTDGIVSAELVLDGGVIATVSFQKQPGFELSTGMYTDVEIRTGKSGGKPGNVFLQVVPLASGTTLMEADVSVFTKEIFAPQSRYGAYGPPDFRVSSAKASSSGDSRTLQLFFDLPSPSGSTASSRALATVIQPKGSNDAVMLICASGEGAWSKLEPSFQKIISSFRVDSVRATKLSRSAKSDYRFEERGGFKETQEGPDF